MVQGCTSSAGKSLLVTALARIYRRRGFSVAPFKAQNMSNNARVVAGGEIGVAQWLQAIAAGVPPDVRMNPILVKPEREGSQVVVDGQVDFEVSNLPWRDRSPRVWPAARQALHSLLEEYALVLMEGAGSPAEFNLWESDIANMRSAEEADAAVLLVVDIDRGGAFAHLYGTWLLLPEPQRERIVGFILNRFRGDASLLAPAPERIEEMTGVPVLGVVPWIAHGLPDEDNASLIGRKATGRRHRVTIVRWPTISNFDEFSTMAGLTDVIWAEDPHDLEGSDLIILPGSKHVTSDLEWFRRRGFEQALAAEADKGTQIVGICGGLQMLGQRLRDPNGIDGEADGLGLLEIETIFEHDKILTAESGVFGTCPEPWEKLSDRSFTGYEIRQGRSVAVGSVVEVLPRGLGYASGNVLGLYVHGVFESSDVLQGLLGVAPEGSLEEEIDIVADHFERSLDMTRIDEILGVAR
ncbi:MAG: cobyric acid synthase [Actinobacteria bacterium]|nr:cobyric acid synthase [Actinomycetota bacterium]